MNVHSHIIGWLNSTDWKLWWFIPLFVASAVIAKIIIKYDKKNTFYGCNFFTVASLVLFAIILLVLVAAFFEVIFRFLIN